MPLPRPHQEKDMEGGVGCIGCILTIAGLLVLSLAGLAMYLWG